MSQVKISGDPSGTGIFTIAAPNSNTSRALVLPDSAGTMATAESTLAQFNVTGSAPVFACRAFVNFNGTGTVSIRASGNVSSITDNGAGDYTVNFATAMPDANYSFSGSVRSLNATNRFMVGQVNAVTQSTTALPFTVVDTNTGNNTDCPTVNILVIR